MVPARSAVPDRDAALPRVLSEPVRLYAVPDAMRLLSMSRSVLYEQIRAGRLKSVTQGRRRLIPSEAIAEYVELLRREADDSAT